MYLAHGHKYVILYVSELLLLLCVACCWPEHNDWAQCSDRRITNSSTMAASLYNHPCYCLYWFIERQQPLVPGSTLPGPAPNLWIVFHFSATYCHAKTLQLWAGASVIAIDAAAPAVNKVLTVNHTSPLHWWVQPVCVLLGWRLYLKWNFCLNIFEGIIM